MAKGKVKKGFGSYLFVLFLSIIATFLVIVTVMLFSPFHNILGFKYFAFKEDKVITEIDANQEQPFNFQTVDKINIDCSFAKVKVVRYYNIDTYGFRFENYISGFAREDQDTDFTYEVYYTDDSMKEINVDVHEPEGFLYFNKNLTVSILVSTKINYSLENTEINITNTTGDIYIGNNTKTVSLEGQDFKNYISIGSLNVKTNDGRIVILPYVNEVMNNLFIKTESGKVQSRINLNITNNCEIYSEKGRLDFKKLFINSNNGNTFDLGNAKLYISHLKGAIEFNYKNGYLDIDKFEGELSSNDAIQQMDKATINIKEFSGYLSLPFANNSKVNIGKVSEESEIYIHSKDGNIKINELYSNVAKLETTTGDVSVKTFGEDIDVKTTKGNINVTFDSDTILDQINLVSKSGTVKFKVQSSLAFNLDVKNTKGEQRKDGKVDVSWLDKLTENPYSVNGGGKVVSIITNGNVVVSVI